MQLSEREIMLNVLTNIVMFAIAMFFILGILAVRGTLYVWLFFLSLFIITLQLTEQISIITSILLWLIVFIGLLLSQKKIRQILLSQHVLKYFRKKLPNTCDTVINPLINSVFESHVFNGNIHWDALLQSADPELTAKEQIFLSNQVEILCQMLNAYDSDLNKIWEYLKQHKFLAMIVPIEYGGLGFSWFAIAEIIQKIATRNVAVAMNIMAPNTLGPHELLLKYGTKLQKEEYLPQLVSGYHIPACAITFHAVDTDNGIVGYGTYQEQEILGIRLNWNKCYVTLGPIATLLCVAVKLYDPNNLLLNNKKDLGVTVCLIPMNFSGIIRDTKYVPLNQTFISGPVKGQNVFVPFDFIIGGKDMIGHGNLMINHCLAIFRGSALTSIGSAIGKSIFKNITAYSVIRQKFGLSIAEFNGTDGGLAKIGVYAYMLNAMRHFSLTALNMADNSEILAAMAKCCITDLARKIINIAMDISGDRANMLGVNNPLASIYQSIPINITIEGSNNSLRHSIIFQSGAVKCHPFLAAEIESLENNNLNIFDQHYCSHISYALSNFAKMILHSCSNKIFCLQKTASSLKKYCRDLSFFSLVLSCLVELAILQHGTLLKSNERLATRLVDLWSHIVMGSAVIKYHNKNLADADEQIMATWCLQKCLYDIQQTIIKILQNFSNKFLVKILTKILTMIIFPFGKKYQAPNDIIEHTISNIILNNISIRTRLLTGSYMATDDNLEIAFKKMLNIATFAKKINLAEKSGVIPKSIDLESTLNMAVQERILTELEANLIREAELAANNAMTVSEIFLK